MINKHSANNTKHTVTVASSNIGDDNHTPGITLHLNFQSIGSLSSCHLNVHNDVATVNGLRRIQSATSYYVEQNGSDSDSD